MESLSPEDFYVQSEWRLTQLNRKRDLAAIRSFRPGVTRQEWEAFEEKIGCGQLPASVREFYEYRSVECARFPRDSAYLIDGLEEVMEALESWISLTEQWQLDMVEEDGMVEVDPEVIKPMWFDAAWIPFLSNGSGDHICMDCNPGPRGERFQMIEVWHDEATRRVVAKSWDDLLSRYFFKEDASD